MIKKSTDHSKPRITVRELSAAEIRSILPMIQHLNPSMTKRLFTARLKQMLPLGYRVVAAFAGDRMVGISGFWIRTRFWCGKQLDIDNFVVSPDLRGGGVGKKIIAWLEKLALSEQCELIVLDTYVSYFLAQRFYVSNGFTNTGYHMTKIPGSNVPFGGGNS
jgi:GNAT superfamily N-acetyltransferase